MTALRELRVAGERRVALVLIAAAALMMCAAASAQSVELSPPAAHRVEFASEVLPILNENCLACHGLDAPQAGLSLHRLEDMVKGGAHGPAVIPGASGDSLLIQRVAGIGGPRMPMGKPPLSAEKVGVLRAWIDQGAKWDGKVPQIETSVRLAPRRPEVPGETDVENPIDAFVEEYFRNRDIEFGEPVSGEVFARRAYLDLWGLVPSPRQLDEFVNDGSDSKRAALVDRLLGDEEKYANHWISYWNDLLRNDEGVIYHSERKSITPWLFGALEKNLPYDEMVRALLNPSGTDAPEGFLIGVNWRGTVNASQTPAMQAAQNSAQVFLGINLKCASCHDSFVNQWKLRDSYGLAAMFDEGELELVRCDVKLGELAKPKFLYPELGGVSAEASLADKRAAAAKLFTTPENGRLARTIVNRYWKLLFGRGLVEPADDMDQPAWDADLLDWLAADFSGHRYDLKHLLRRIMTSRAYQLPAVAASGPDEVATPQDQRDASSEVKYTFRGPRYRRLTAEQFADSISAITGEWRIREGRGGEPNEYAREWRLKASPLTRAMGRAVRDQVITERVQQPTTLQALELESGETLAALLERGAKRLLGAIEPAPKNVFDSGVMRSQPKTIEADITAADELWLLAVDVDSYDPSRVKLGWAWPEVLGPDGAVPLTELPRKSGPAAGPLTLGEATHRTAWVSSPGGEFVFDISGRGFTRLRATIGVDDSSKSSDINANVRFFVFGEQPDRTRLIRVAEQTPVEPPPAAGDTGGLLERLYRQSFSRGPSAGETAAAREMMTGADGKPSAAGLEDLLWSLFLSPEFQFIR